MDRRAGKRFANYSVREIEEYLSTDPLRKESKRGFELLVGCVLARCREQVGGEFPEVGYMVKGNYAKSETPIRPTLEEFLKSDAIEDNDVDIWLQTRTPIQVTRLEHHRTKDDPNEGLIELIEKKLLIEEDEYLQLVILIDYSFTLDMKRLRTFLCCRSIPFKRIYIVGQFGNDPKLGNFTCLEIYPETYISNVKLDIS